ncbi:MAG: hypothetical protein HY444_10335 [Nitrospirae bacterium]|nr:hypothetical protein [Nitrospirota bacterium]
MTESHAMTTPLTTDTIESVINALPIQGRIMLRLLLLQYLDTTAEDVEFIAVDRPDPRFQAGVKSLVQVVARETLQSITDRIAQYRNRVRQKREQTWLQIDCLRKQIAYGEALCAHAERLLRERFGLDADATNALRTQARAAIQKPAIRELDRQWDKNEIEEEEYRRKRLGIEYQTELRKLERERKRLETALRDYSIAGHAPLQDHEIGHIWGIPAGTLAARKAKFLHQYLQGLQSALPPTSQPSVDLWKETFRVLAGRPVERSTVPYDGLDRTEASLMERLTTFAVKATPEDFESRAWLAISLSLFALQRLSAIQNEQDTDSAALEQVLLQRSSPAPKESEGKPETDAAAAPLELNEMGEHVLHSMKGEAHKHLNSLLFLVLTDIIAACMA